MEFKLRKNKRINENYFDDINTEEKAYLLGFFLADGCISTEHNDGSRAQNFRFTVNNSIDDEEIINKFSSVICPDNIVAKKTKLNNDKVVRKPQLCVRWSSKYMFDQFISKYNITPRKTKDTTFKFPFETIPQDLVRHFIRGFFDGDGSVSSHNYGNTIYFNFSFTSTSQDFLNQIADIIEPLHKDVKRHFNKQQGKNMICYDLRFKYNKNRTECIKLIYDWLYDNSTIYLNRKKTKFEYYFQYRANCTNKQWTVV